MGEIAVQLQQTEAARVLVLEGVELQLLRVIQRPADPFAVPQPHRQPIGVVDLRVDGIAHPALVVAAAEHTGHRRDTQLFDVLAGIKVIFHVHDDLGILAMDGELVGPGDARAIQQRVNGKDRGVPFNRFEPEGGEIRELFRGIGKGVYRQPTSRQAVLVGAVYRAEITGAKERHDIAAGQLRRFKHPESGEAEVGLPFQLAGVDPGVIVLKQLRAEMDLARLLSGGVKREHPHAATEPHPDVEKLDVQFAFFDVVP
ncbi:putative uncharacterized protein [Klebsiella variicola CAG:634]|nr:putative uncharacterized protein [Klebsiella variicola CAG:634]